MSHLYSFLDDRELYGSGGGGARGEDAPALPGPQVSVAMTRQQKPGATAAPPVAQPPAPAGPDMGALLDAVFGGLARVERRLVTVEERIAASLERLAALEEKRAVASRGDGWWSWAATLLLLAVLCYGLLRATNPRVEASAFPVLVSQPPAAPTPVLYAPTAPPTFLPTTYASLRT